MPGKRARSAAKTVDEQARGTGRNVRDLWRRWQLDDLLPSAIAGFIQELISLIPYALGRSSAYRQIAASIALIIIAILLTPFTLGWSLVLAIPWAITLTIGLVRLVPAANDRYRRLRGGRLRDRDIRRWRRD